MDIRIDNDFNLAFDSNLQLVDSIEEQKQRLFIFLKTPKGSLFYDPQWGLDYSHIVKLIKVNSLTQIKTYLFNVIQDLKIDIVNLNVKIQSNTISIVFHFPNDTLNMEVKL
ncbi:hypothetical protein BDCR2A_01596 [Borrelia duttonii CR2A]|uniref:Uncharacterized protein n=1 Tax=Borrelia duttonii CR2A TaxID=1432657 RepID=W6TFH0_9SPIR|nr:DUF2634 domain-containing protein [Borrelia duttonii]ETZ17497.1 hypothetical protein BDCR2A_01596 [Borrelia duttonii CR2A]